MTDSDTESDDGYEIVPQAELSQLGPRLRGRRWPDLVTRAPCGCYNLYYRRKNSRRDLRDGGRLPCNTHMREG